jgi:ankyrin repeat protein
LIEHGADVNLRTHAGRTPLDWAVRNGRKQAAELLRVHGGQKATPHDDF